jgi:cobalamin biosynthesis protein CobT
MTATIEPLGGFKSLLDDSFIFDRIKESDYPSFVTKTIQMLGRQSGLKLRFAKKVTGSCFDQKTKTVMIPPPPAYPRKQRFDSEEKHEANMENFKARLAEWRGVLNHEVGHAMFTLWMPDTKPNAETKKYYKDYHKYVDLFENGRMERVVCEYYPGMRRDLVKLEDLLGSIIKDMHKKDPENFNALYYGMRMAVNGYEPAVEIPEALKEKWDQCMEFVKEAYETNDEQETIEISMQVHEYLSDLEKEMAKNLEKKKKEQEELQQKLQEAMDEMDGLKMEAENADGSEGGMSGGDNSDSEEEDGEKEQEEKGKAGESEEEKEESKSESDADSEGKSSEEENESEKGKSKEDIEKEIEEKEKEIEDIKNKLKEKEEEINESPKPKEVRPDNVVIIDPTSEFHKEVMNQIESVKDYGGDVVPLPLHDYVDNIDVEVPSASPRTKQILSECLKNVSGMAQRFIQKVRSSINVGVRTYQGRISRKHLHRYKTTKNIFKQEMKRKKRGASVKIIIDCSGSMSGYGSNSKINTARKAALVLGEMMFQAKVEFEIVGFTIPFNSDFNFGAFTRKANLVHYRFGSNKNWNTKKHSVVDGHMTFGLEDNDDAESLRHFADELSQSKKERKMMVVISDGEPMARNQTGDMDADLTNTIADIRRRGMEVYAIGLNTKASNYYGEKNAIELSSSCSTDELVQAINKFVGLISAN